MKAEIKVGNLGWLDFGGVEWMNEDKDWDKTWRMLGHAFKQNIISKGIKPESMVVSIDVADGG